MLLVANQIKHVKEVLDHAKLNHGKQVLNNIMSQKSSKQVEIQLI